MRTKLLAVLTLAGALALTSCSKDGDIIYTDGAQNAEVEGTDTDIILDKDNLDALALTVYWNENGDITLSDPEVAPPSNAATNVLQMSTSEAFTSTYEETMEDGVYVRQFTCSELNSVLNRLGVQGGETAVLYIRVKTTVGDNIAAKYSNVLSVNVTTYYIDMTLGFVLDASKSDTGVRLANDTNLSGVYTGFMGAGSWYNWWLMEGNNVTWGNLGVDGKPFYMDNTDSDDEVWNFWFPGVSGCYFVTVDTEAREWSALLIPELNIGGDLTGAMTYDRKQNKWTYVFEAEAKTYNITLSGSGKLYDVNTGTDDAAAIDKNVGFGGSATALTFGESATSVAVSVSSAGETTLTVDLNDPQCWTVSASAGAADPTPTVPEYLYLSGVYGDWTFDWYLRLYNEDNKTYGGVLPVDSEWGYRMYSEADNWDNYYSMVDGGTAYEGSIESCGANNFTAPAAGTYLFDVSLSDMTYKLYSVTSVSYTGLNDDWSMTAMQATDTPCVYTAEVTKSANTPWGVKILINESWDLYFGGDSSKPGELFLFHDGFEGDNDLANGTYILTVDLAKGTYSYTAK